MAQSVYDVLFNTAHFNISAYNAAMARRLVWVKETERLSASVAPSVRECLGFRVRLLANHWTK
jgi:hypothetical protein